MPDDILRIWNRGNGKKAKGGMVFLYTSEWVRYEPAVPFTQVAIISLGISVSVCLFLGSPILSHMTKSSSGAHMRLCDAVYIKNTQ